MPKDTQLASYIRLLSSAGLRLPEMPSLVLGSEGVWARTHMSLDPGFQESRTPIPLGFQGVNTWGSDNAAAQIIKDAAAILTNVTPRPPQGESSSLLGTGAGSGAVWPFPFHCQARWAGLGPQPHILLLAFVCTPRVPAGVRACPEHRHL